MKKGQQKGNKKKQKDEQNKTPEQESGDKLDQVLNGINILAGAVNKLVELQTAEPVKKEKEDKTDGFVAPIEDETYPKRYVPAAFRKVVDEILSPEFGVSVDDFEDRTDFQLNIVVPDKFSSVTKEDKEKGIQDIRSRMIPRSLGINGVKEWCTLIRKNLSRYYQKEGIGSPFKNIQD